MNIEFGSIEYFSLLSFEDKLQPTEYDKFDLMKLDELRVEVARKIGAIHLREQQRIERAEERKGKAFDDLGTTLREGEESGEGV